MGKLEKLDSSNDEGNISNCFGTVSCIIQNKALPGRDQQRIKRHEELLCRDQQGLKDMKNFSVETNKGSEGCSNQFDAETCELLESILNLVCDTPVIRNTSRCETQMKALALKGCNKGTDYSGSPLWKMLDESRCELNNCCSC